MAGNPVAAPMSAASFTSPALIALPRNWAYQIDRQE